MKNCLIVALLLAMISCEKQDKSFEGDNKVDITSFKKLPIVEGTLNGKKAFFILDTGATITVMDLNQQDFYVFNLGNQEDEAIGYGGAAIFYSLENAILEIGGVRFYTNFKCQNLSHIVNATRNGEGVTIAGIVGSDIMKPNKFILDFSNNSISLGK